MTRSARDALTSSPPTRDRPGIGVDIFFVKSARLQQAIFMRLYGIFLSDNIN